MIQLRGITWNHSRGYLPMVATAQRFSEARRFSELHPDVEITWEKRSLQAFGDYPLQKLVDKFDLLIIDHPFVGYAANHDVLVPLEDFLPSDFLADQAANGVGKSHESYSYSGHQWALATDAATPVASYRPDLLAQHDLAIPKTWEEVLELARHNLVIVPAVAIDSLMNFYYFCVSQGAEMFVGESLVAEEVGVRGLEQLRELVTLCPKECLERNPIKTYEALSTGDYVYCPFAYGYSNYARDGYAEHLLKFTNVISLSEQPGQTTLGGTGLAISTHCKHKDVAAQYAQFVHNSKIQQTLYVENGGQPGHRSAWLSEEVNRRSNHFFSDTLPTLDNAYLRPRYDGYLHFQDLSGPVVDEYLKKGDNPKSVLRTLQRIYADSLKGSDPLEYSL
jgi:multiple sugar transport system substrate-binding protein